MSITTRIYEICEMYDISDRNLSLEAGLNAGYMNKTREMDREIGSLKVEKIYKVLNKMIHTKINPEWFLVGKGPKFLSGYAINESGMMVVRDHNENYNFEDNLLSALDSEAVQDKLKAVLSLK